MTLANNEMAIIAFNASTTMDRGGKMAGGRVRKKVQGSENGALCVLLTHRPSWTSVSPKRKHGIC